MARRTRALVAGVVLAAALWSFAGIAGANRLEFRNSLATREWRSAWSAEFTGGFGTVRCPLTLEGSLHSSTITKTARSLVGVVTGARAGECGIVTLRTLTANLPWHVRYQIFTGTLPNIGSVGFEIIGFEFQMIESGFGVTCLFRSEERQPLFMTWSRINTGSVTSSTLGGSITSSECGLNVRFGGSTSVTPATSINLI